jgi:flagellar basal body P-ring formation protein FlgA
MRKIYGKILFFTLMVCSLMLIGPSPVFCKQSPEEILMEQIRQHVEKNMLWPADSMRMEFLSRLPAMDKFSGKITYSIESRPKEQYIGDTSFGVRIFSNSIFVREETVRVRIEVLRDLVVSTNSISRDSILSASDVTVQKKWMRNVPLNALSLLDEAVGKNIVVGIGPNTQITKSMLKEVMPVKKGKMVQVILDNGVMKMMMSGVAEEDGADDSMVKVRNLNSNKIIFARVVGQGKVQVDF